MKNNIPRVRIGMIQSADEIHFGCDSTFTVFSLGGEKVATGLAGQNYTVGADHCKPSQIFYCVRLAIAITEAEKKRRQEELAQRGIATTAWRPGVVLSLGGGDMDNREYWMVTEPFADENAAREYARTYEPIGEAVVVKDIIRKSSGTLLFGQHRLENGLRIVADKAEALLQLHDVTVGIEFHWQHKRTQLIPGVLEINLNNAGHLQAINELDIESYLMSVNSSEMTKDNPIELLKAQTIAARSTILATMGKHHYDENFHICSDDHCQCYHGVGNISQASRQAAHDTLGENLLHDGRVCDARYAKICGGIMEDYRDIWDHREIPYLVPGSDGRENMTYPLRDEQQVKDYIDSSPDVWCNTQKYEIPSSLPYNTRELFRWKVSYEREELEALISRRLDENFGDLIDIIPGDRAPGGRLIYMDVVGSKRTLRVGKELMIRRALSESHLYSACFYIERAYDAAGKITHFHLIGAGWGHGVGLCQVGATVMAQQGFDYRAILAHYYKNSKLEKLY